jgi:purine nucleosidase
VTRKFLIDTDTASDDAVALVIALRCSDIEVECITLVAGNCNLDQAVQNALYTIELCGADVAVYAGEAGPLSREPFDAVHVHGVDGMGDIGLPLRGRSPAGHDGVDKIIETVHAHAGDLEIVTLGPLTNMARAVERDPGIAARIKQCTVMGGSPDGRGNVWPGSCFNIFADPEAARVVYHAGLKLRMVGWDISRKFAVVTKDEQRQLRTIGTELAIFSHDIQKCVSNWTDNTTNLAGYDLPDPIAMAIAIDPSIATKTGHFYIDIETNSELTRGQTVVDYNGTLGKGPNVELVIEASHDRFMETLFASVR